MTIPVIEGDIGLDRLMSVFCLFLACRVMRTLSRAMHELDFRTAFMK